MRLSKTYICCLGFFFFGRAASRAFRPLASGYPLQRLKALPLLSLSQMQGSGRPCLLRLFPAFRQRRAQKYPVRAFLQYIGQINSIESTFFFNFAPLSASVGSYSKFLAHLRVLATSERSEQYQRREPKASGAVPIQQAQHHAPYLQNRRRHTR